MKTEQSIIKTIIIRQLYVLSVIAFIIFMLWLCTGRANAQVPPKQYQPTEVEMQTRLSVQLSFTAIELNNYSFVLKQGGPEAVMNMNNISAAQAKQLLSDYSKFIDSAQTAANRVFTKWYKAGHDKWAADTLKERNRAAAKVDTSKAKKP